MGDPVADPAEPLDPTRPAEPAVTVGPAVPAVPVQPGDGAAPAGPSEPDGDPGHSWGEFETVEELLRHRLSQAVGGWRGALDASLPTAAFTVLWLVTDDLRTSLVAALAMVGLVAVIRLVRREPMVGLIPAALGVAVAAFFAMRSGQAQDVFLPGIYWNIGYGSLFLVSNLARWPLLGFVVAAAEPNELLDDPFRWHRHTGIVRVAVSLTWVFVVLYAVRVAVQVPLYLHGEVVALGVSKIALGWPAYLLAVTWVGVILVRGHTPLDDA